MPTGHRETPKTMPIEVVDIRRNPVKGLSAEPLDRVGLSPAKGPPHDHEAGRYWYVSVVDAASAG